MSAQKTLYVREGSEEVWERAEKLSGESVSSLVDRLLRDYIQRQERQEALAGDSKRIVVEVSRDDTVTSKAFQGTWVIVEFESEDPNVLGGTQYNVALTRNKRLVACISSRDDDPGRVESFEVFDSFDQFAADTDGYPHDLISAVANEIGEDFVEDLDI